MADKRKPNGQFLPGNGGRPQGVRNRLQHDFLKALQEDFAEHGAAVVRIARIEKPIDYLKVIAAVLPKELIFTDNKLAEFSDEEIAEMLASIRKSRAGDDDHRTH